MKKIKKKQPVNTTWRKEDLHGEKKYNYYYYYIYNNNNNNNNNHK